MTTTTEKEKSNGIIRFTGEDESKFPGWKKWAKARLFRLETSGTEKKALGAELFGLLEPDSLAFEAVKDISEDVLFSEAGVKALWTMLEERFPEK